MKKLLLSFIIFSSLIIGANVSAESISSSSLNTVSGCLDGAVYNSKTGMKCQNEDAYVTLVYPKAGSTLIAGESVNVKWNSSNPNYGLLNVKIRGDKSSVIIEVDTPNDGFEAIIIPKDTPSAKYIVEVGNGSVMHPIIYTTVSFNVASGDRVDKGCLSGEEFSSMTGDKCPDYDTPSIEVLSPNGGETYYLGDKINIKWKSNGLPKNAKVAVYLEEMPDEGYGTNHYGLSQEMLKNDGQELIALTPAGMPNKYGKYFKIVIVYYIEDNIVNVIEDTSDNYFTINETSPSLIAQCLKDKGAVLYTATWCSFCQKQKDLFGKSFKKINNVVCSKSVGDDQSEICNEENITGYPTWKFEDGSILNGTQSLLDLSEKVGCNLPTEYLVALDDGCQSGQKYSLTTGNKCQNDDIFITLVYPKSGSTLIAGQSINVKWNSKLPDLGGYSGWQIKAIIKHGGVVVKEIRTSNDGEESIKIPASAPAGKYEIEFGTKYDSSGGEHYTKYGVVMFNVVSPNDKDLGCFGGAKFSSTTGKVCPGTNNSVASKVSQCLIDQGAVLYGASWCPHCQSQKQLFENYADSIPYVECSNPDNGEKAQVCIDAKINSYPTWRFKDGTELSGAQSLASLAKKVGCSVSATPIRRTLKQGVSGDDVRALQEYLQIEDDGVFGKGTAEKVRQWQRQNGLVSDGSFGLKSRQTAGLE